MDWGIAGVNSISARSVPGIGLPLVDDGVPALEVAGEFEESIILGFDEVAEDLLLDYLATPVLVEPRLLNFFLDGVCKEQGVLRAGNIQVDLSQNTLKIIV